MNAIVQETANGWRVVVDGKVIADGMSNSEAWRLADRWTGEPISKREDTADWFSRKESADFTNS